MANRDRYIERDLRSGRERLVIRASPRRSSSRNRLSTVELLNAAEEREEVLIMRNEQLRDQLGFVQSQEQRAKEELRQVTARLQSQAEVTRELHDRLDDEKEKTAALEERLRLLQRTNRDTYRQRFEAAVNDVRALTAAVDDRDRDIRLKEAQIATKTQTIVQLRQRVHELTNHLRDVGFEVRNRRMP